MNKIIGEFCSMAEKDTIILPKKIPGYAAPEGQGRHGTQRRLRTRSRPNETRRTQHAADGRAEPSRLHRQD